MSTPTTANTACARLRDSPADYVKVAISDIDGVLRGKYLDKAKFLSSIDGGFGFCDVVFGWDSADECYDNAHLHRLAVGLSRRRRCASTSSTHRQIPWEADRDFFLGDYVGSSPGTVVCPRLRAAVGDRAGRVDGLRRQVRHGVRVLQLPRVVAVGQRQGLPRPRAADARHVRLLDRCARRRTSRSSRPCSASCAPSACRSKGCTPRPGPACSRRPSSTATRSRPPIGPSCSSPAPRRSAPGSASCRASWPAWNTDLPGCSGHTHQSLWDVDGERNLFADDGDPRPA